MAILIETSANDNPLPHETPGIYIYIENYSTEIIAKGVMYPTCLWIGMYICTDEIKTNNFILSASNQPTTVFPFTTYFKSEDPAVKTSRLMFHPLPEEGRVTS